MPAIVVVRMTNMVEVSQVRASCESSRTFLSVRLSLAVRLVLKVVISK